MEGYKITENPTSYYFKIGKKGFDENSKKLLTRFSVAKFGHVNYFPCVVYPKSIAHSAQDAEGAFLNDLVKGAPIFSLVDNKRKQVGKVTFSRGKYHFELTTQYIGQKIKEDEQTVRPVGNSALENLLKKAEPTETKPVAEPKETKPVYSEPNPATVSKVAPVPTIIVDPSSKEAKALIGKTVEISKMFSFADCKKIKLSKVEVDSPIPFYGDELDTGRQVGGMFIRPYHVIKTPLDLNDKSVRDSLRGKWIFNKASGQECLVSNFRKENGQYICNGLNARTLMESWEFEDGGFIGVEK